MVVSTTFIYLIIWDSPFTKATTSWAGDAGLLSRQGNFLFDTVSQISLGVHLTSYAVVSGGSLPKNTAAGDSL